MIAMAQDITTRDDIRDVASTLAHLWCGEQKDREGVRRILCAYPPSYRMPLCVNISYQLHGRGMHSEAQSFEAFLFDAAGIPER